MSACPHLKLTPGFDACTVKGLAMCVCPQARLKAEPPCVVYWTNRAEAADKRIADLESDLATNAKLLAQQCDLARQAEIERDAWQRKAEG